MQVQFIGCGDAFGSGGRFNTCFHVTGARCNFLIDCGASSLVALKQSDIELNEINTILITHFHFDHFGGLPSFILDAQFFSNRTQPLTIAGPGGLRDWFKRATEIAFQGSSATSPKFDLEFVELEATRTTTINDLIVTPYDVVHGPADQAFFAYRVEAEDKIIAYTGDTQWTDVLIEVGQQVDLFIAEAYFFNKKIPYHLDLETLESYLPDINPKKLILTHMSHDMLLHEAEVTHICAHDGMVISI